MTNFQGNLNIPVDGQRGFLRYTGAETLSVGDVIVNPDPSEVDGDAEKSQARAAKPASANVNQFAGIVERKQVGSGRVKVARSGLAYVNVESGTEEGDLLKPQAGSYEAIECSVIADDVGYMEAREDVGNTTSGLALCILIPGGKRASSMSITDVNNCIFMKDFLEPYDSGNWTVTNTDGAGDAGEVNAVNDAQFGILTLTTNDAEDDAEQHVWTQESFQFTSGNSLYCDIRAKVSAATEIDISLGLIATEDLTAGTLIPNDGAVFKKDDGDTNIDIASAKDGTDDTSDAVATLDTDYHKYGIHYDGDGTITFYFDDEEVGSTTAAASIVEDEEIAPHLMVLAGSAAARTLETDYIRVVQSR